MNITSARWINTMAGDTVLPNKENIWAVIDGETLQVPTDPMNRHYIEIQKQVAAGTLTIEDAD
tara:strand:+ start:18351 stop:18539 length:189 start_codon:yes stop_codon:yes gene_type:complete